MLDTDTKRRIDTARDILVGKVPDPKSQVEQITIALIYKFMDDMDAEAGPSVAHTAAAETRTTRRGSRHLKPDISTLGERGHFYLGLTCGSPPLEIPARFR
jgi:hypothetical protein